MDNIQLHYEIDNDWLIMFPTYKDKRKEFNNRVGLYTHLIPSRERQWGASRVLRELYL
jgi:hypothetical protein